MATSIFGIGVSALNAAQAALVTTQHNIANANTAGFHRQQTVQVNAIPQFTGAGFLGQGVQVDTVKRIYNQFLDNQVQLVQTRSSQLDAYSAQIKQIDNLLADPSAGLSPALQDFFKSVQDVASNPASGPSRQSLLSGGQLLSSRFQAINQRLDEVRSGVNSQVINSVDLVNGVAQQIATLNEKISLAQSSGGGSQPPNDLLDQRDDLVTQLNQQVNASVLKQSDGSYNVFIGNGQALVVGQQAFALRAVVSATDPGQMDLGYVSGSSTVFIDPTSLQGGTLGGLLAFRSESLNSTQNALGRVAIGFVQTMNDQHRLGQDLSNTLGGDFFKPVSLAPPISNTNNSGTATLGLALNNAAGLTSSDYRVTYDGTNYTLTRLSDNTQSVYASLPQTVDGFTVSLASGAPAAGDSFLLQPVRNGARDISVAISDTAKIAVAAPISTTGALANTGSGKISAGSVNTPPPPNVNLQQPVTITFTSATTFNVTGTGTGNPVGVTYTPGADVTYNGWTMQISGAPVAGDSFAVSANTNGVSDNRNALLMAGFQTKNTLVGGTTSYQGAYSQLVSQVGNKTREIEVAGQAQTNLLQQTKQTQQSLSGVNLDEEAANLVRFQQAYQAAGKAMQIASTLFQTLLDLGK